MKFSLPLRDTQSDEAIWKTVTVAAVSARAQIGDYEQNALRFAQAIGGLDESVQLVVTPEIALGYQRERAYHQAGTFELEFALMMKHIAPLSRNRLILWGLPVYVSGCPYNAVAYLYGGTCLGFGAKTKLAQGGEYEDSRYFTPLEPGFVTEIRIGAQEQSYPFGDIVVDIGGLRVKALICEDLWFEGGPAAKVAEEGVDIIGWLNTSHEQVAKQGDRVKIIDVTSLRTSTAIVSANALGVQGGHHVFSGSNLIASAGSLLAAQERYKYQPWVSTVATVDVAQLRNLKMSNHSHRSHTPKAHIVFHPGSLYSGAIPDLPLDEKAYLGTLEDDLDALEIIACWIWEQFLASRQQGFLVLNSGGSDSRMHLLLICYALKRAYEELGLNAFRKTLHFIAGIDTIGSLEEFIAKHVFGPYIQGITSGSDTQSAAKLLAEVLGFHYSLAQIGDLERELNLQTTRLCGGDLDLSWKNPAVTDNYRLDRTLQNAPARLRGILGWQMANVLGLFYFGTSNLDEVWSKYFTLSGDDSAAAGGLAGCGKLRIQRVQSIAARRLGVFQQLVETINTSIATAELRPEEMAQSDEADCGKLVYRTACRELMISQDKSALQAFLAICYQFADPQQSAFTQLHLLEDVAFAVIQFTRPALGMHWARMQLPLSPVVEAGPQHAATEESNRRAACDLRFIHWTNELLEYLQLNCPEELITGLAKRSGTVASWLQRGD